ncbi:MAG: hypothetical protein C0446_01265 [Chitinophaga sp.]|nr:hypothetical protein [Chitinophaga sp.]
MQKFYSVLIISFTFSFAAFAQPNNNKNPEPFAQIKRAGEKEVYIPGKVFRTPDNNNYLSDTSEFSFSRMAESKNIVAFWSKEFGKDPMLNPIEQKRFDIHNALNELERFYEFYVNQLKLVLKGKSLTDQYKMVLYVIGGNGGTAFGGGAENKIGMLWTPAARMTKAPYGALAHELGHSFQFMIRADNGRGPRGAISEMSAQYMLWQVYPEWMTFENYHLKDFMKKTHYAFLHPTNMYHSPYVFEYWSNKHGIEFFGKLSRETLDTEDPVATYKRITNISQEQFNDEMFDASRRFITWDMKRIDSVARPYANQHFTDLKNAKEKDWYIVPAANCPQNYGYNGIQLKVPKSGSTVTLHFTGIAGAEGYQSVNIEKAGWRYGFVAYQKNGNRVYSTVGKNSKGELKFKVPNDTEYLWLVVMGAPTEHWPVSMGRQRTDADTKKEEQWPYQFKLAGSSPLKLIQ